MPKPKHVDVDPVVLDVYRRMVESVPGAEVKGDTIPYTSINGNMYSSISKANRIGVRLPKDARDAFLEQHGTTLFEALPGFFQKEYVAVPEAIYQDADTLASLFRASHDYASSLKPKKTTRG